VTSWRSVFLVFALMGCTGSGQAAYRPGWRGPQALGVSAEKGIPVDAGFACHEVRTGKEVYGKRRIDAGVLFSASPVVVEGKLHSLSEEGDIYVVKAGPQYRAFGQEFTHEVCRASPAVSKMFIRSFKHL
jgi:hypothetical protein